MTSIRAAVAGLVLAASQPALALNIVFDYTYDTTGFFANATRTSLLDAAAQVFETRLQDQLLGITSSGNDHFNAKFSHPTAGGVVTLSDYSVAANELRVFVGASSSLGSGVLGTGGPGGFSVSTTNQTFFDTVRGRGQDGALASPKTDFGPWGGALSFSNSATWYFDTNVSTTESFSGSDFYSVAVHELGHLLGVGAAGSWDAKVVGLNFTGTASQLSYGGPVPLADSGHWQSGLASAVNGVAQEAAMDPTLSNGQRKQFTDLDFAALQDIGWQVAPVPEADTWAMMLAGIALVGYRLRRRQEPRQSV